MEALAARALRRRALRHLRRGAAQCRGAAEVVAVADAYARAKALRAGSVSAPVAATAVRPLNMRPLLLHARGHTSPPQA